ncbi:MAG: hypothetical protein OEY56_06680 [Cyclobacteriaceae bacterium]|nr:hypothetical protein [Cyclobacteriaceae bacterium]
MRKYIVTLLLLPGYIASVLAQSSDIEMADQFRGEGKIYIVIAVILLILGGIFLTLLRLGKKLTKLEQEIEDEKK